MTKKAFCDVCDAELARNYVSERIAGRGYKDGNDAHLVEIIVGSDTTWNAGDLCRDCLRAIVLDAIDSDLSARTTGRAIPDKS